jgi:hypothetical protein
MPKAARLLHPLQEIASGVLRAVSARQKARTYNLRFYRFWDLQTLDCKHIQLGAPEMSPIASRSSGVMTTKKAKTEAQAGEAPTNEPGKENRYLRASRVIIEAGEGIVLAELAMKAELSTGSAAYCLEAYKNVCQALRDAKLLPAKRVPAKTPTAPGPLSEAQPESIAAN